jgi:hypothetical protein
MRISRKSASMLAALGSSKRFANINATPRTHATLAKKHV